MIIFGPTHPINKRSPPASRVGRVVGGWAKRAKKCLTPRPPQSRERINFRDERQTQSALTITLIPGIAARGRKVALASPNSSFALQDCSTVADELPACGDRGAWATSASAITYLIS